MPRMIMSDCDFDYFSSSTIVVCTLDGIIRTLSCILFKTFAVIYPMEEQSGDFDTQDIING